MDCTRHPGRQCPDSSLPNTLHTLSTELKVANSPRAFDEYHGRLHRRGDGRGRHQSGHGDDQGPPLRLPGRGPADLAGWGQLRPAGAGHDFIGEGGGQEAARSSWRTARRGSRRTRSISSSRATAPSGSASSGRRPDDDYLLVQLRRRECLPREQLGQAQALLARAPRLGQLGISASNVSLKPIPRPGSRNLSPDNPVPGPAERFRRHGPVNLRDGPAVTPITCFRASRTRCGSSGRMIRVIASSTAAREPGMTSTRDPADQPADGPAQHARRADLGVAEHPEQLADSRAGAWSGAPRPSRTSGRGADPRPPVTRTACRSPRAANRCKQGPHHVGLVGHDRPLERPVPRPLGQLDDPGPRGVGLARPRVRDRHDRQVQRAGAPARCSATAWLIVISFRSRTDHARLPSSTNCQTAPIATRLSASRPTVVQ